MLESTLDREHAILHIHPTGPLHAEDFAELAREVDPFIEETGQLKGLLIEAAHFPGWENPAAAVRHIRFVRAHHRKIVKVALVTDSAIGKAAEQLASHFVRAEVRHFTGNQAGEAQAWLIGE